MKKDVATASPNGRNRPGRSRFSRGDTKKAPRILRSGALGISFGSPRRKPGGGIEVSESNYFAGFRYLSRNSMTRLEFFSSKKRPSS